MTRATMNSHQHQVECEARATGFSRDCGCGLVAWLESPERAVLEAIERSMGEVRAIAVAAAHEFLRSVAASQELILGEMEARR